MLTRDAILGQVQFATEVVDVPEWGGELLVREMSAFERDRFEQLQNRFNAGEAMPSVMAQVVSWCAVDENGKALFTVKDVDGLGRLSAAPVQRVFKAIVRLSALGGLQAASPDDEVAAARENFPDAPADDSSSS